MNFLTLEYFVAAAEEQSIRKAAKRLYISEQALSESIKKLEEEMDVRLINRTRPLMLTPAGEIFLIGSREILDIKQALTEEIAESMQKVGEIQFGLALT